MTDATQLLRAWAEHGSEDAFRELVRRYLDLVWSVARRQTGGDAHAAADIVQQVFTDLARQTRRGRGPLAGGPCALGGWLHRHTCFVAANYRRAERRRQAREQTAAAMNSLELAGESAWQALAPVLDETLNELEPADREALLLRFYERRDLRAVGAALGVSEDAAQKRVARALEKLRGLLAARGVSLGGAVLAGLLGERAVEAAPAALVGRVSRAALAAGAGSGLAWLGALLATGKGKLAVGLAAAALVTVPLAWYLSRDSSPLRRSAGDRAETAAALAGNARDSSRNVSTGSASGLAPTSLPAAATAPDPEALVLTLLDAERGQPMPNVAVDYRCWTGTDLDRRTLHGTREGLCEVRFPRGTATHLQLTTRCEGFADTRLEWRPDRGEQIPFEYTLRLERAVPIGGMVVDPDGQPVAGAKVSFGHLEDPALERRPESHAFGWLQVETDSEGRWQVNRIAEEILRRCIGGARHPDFVISESVEVGRSPDAERQLRIGQYVFHLRRGVTVRGVVVDGFEQPIAEATVRVGMLGEVHARETRTLADGSFEVTGCQPGRKPVSAEAPGFAVTTVEADIQEATPPLRLVLQPGKTLRFRTVDRSGQPLPKVWFGYSTLGGLRRQMNPPATLPPQVVFGGETDAEGRAVWENAPEQELAFAFAKPGYQRRDDVFLRPGEQEHVIVLEPALTIAGTVSDAVTGKPIPNFRIICGWPETFGSEQRPRWSSIDRHQLAFSGGTFRHLLEEAIIGGIPNPGYVFKFEAEGYSPFVTRVFRPDEGEVEFAVKLQPAETVTVTVLLPNGQPAARCDVGFVSPGANLTLLPSGIERGYGGGAVLTADAAGRFRLPPDDTVAAVVAAHPEGFALVPRAILETEPVLRLQPWARVEGRIWRRGKPAAGRELTLSFFDVETLTAIPLDFESYRVVSDARGEFQFDKVPPGRLSLVELIPFETSDPQPGKDWSIRPLETLQARPGQTAFVEVGKDGRAVRLRLRGPQGTAPDAGETFTFATIITPTPLPPAEVRNDAQALAAWHRRPEIQAALMAARHWPLKRVADGTWEAEDMAPGQYVIRAGYPSAAGAAYPTLFEAPVVVPAGDAAETLDLGEIALQPAH